MSATKEKTPERKLAPAAHGARLRTPPNGPTGGPTLAAAGEWDHEMPQDRLCRALAEEFDGALAAIGKCIDEAISMNLDTSRLGRQRQFLWDAREAILTADRLLQRALDPD